MRHTASSASWRLIPGGITSLASCRLLPLSLILTLATRRSSPNISRPAWTFSLKTVSLREGLSIVYTAHLSGRTICFLWKSRHKCRQAEKQGLSVITVVKLLFMCFVIVPYTPLPPHAHTYLSSHTPFSQWSLQPLTYGVIKPQGAITFRTIIFPRLSHSQWCQTTPNWRISSGFTIFQPLPPLAHDLKKEQRGCWIAVNTHSCSLISKHERE